MTVYEDLAKALADVQSMDWSPDGSYTKNMKAIHYVTLSKMKKNVASALTRNGLCLAVEYSRPEWLPPAMQSKPEHVLIEMKATIYGSSGDAVSFRSWGQGATNDDKGVSIARAYAMRTFLIDTFLISDYIEPEESDAVDFIPNETVKTALQKRAVPEEAPAVKKQIKKPMAASASDPEPKQEPKPKEEQKTEQKTEIQEQKTEDEEIPQIETVPLSPIQKRAISNFKTKIDMSLDNGSMTPEEAQAARDALSGITNDALFHEFMQKKSSWGL